MKNEKYIKTIEELNKEYLDYTHSKAYLKNNRKQKTKKYIKNFAYKRLFNAFKTSLYNRFNKPRNIPIEIKEISNLKKGKIVVYTCIIDNYDDLLSPIIKTEDTDYIVFSNDSNIAKNTNYWQYREISVDIRKKCNNSALLNRYIKMHPFELFPEYDLALYIDGNVQIISNIQKCFQYINDKTGLAMHSHDKRVDVYEEAKACIKLHKGNKQNIKKLIAKYENEQFPHNFGLYQASVIAVDLKNKKAKDILDEWFLDFEKNNTGRDQLILPYILWKKHFQYTDIGFLGSNIYCNVKFRVNEHNFQKNKLMLFLIHIKRKIKNFGLKHKCNICSSNIKKWRDGGDVHPIFADNQIVGAGYRKRFRCPVCGMKDKDRLVYYYLKNYTDVFTGCNTILHIAPEKLIYQKFKNKCKFNKKIKYYNGDLDPTKADMFLDITNIDFPDNSFDYIICNHVLEHVIDEKQAFSEIKRVIKPFGKIILTVPVCISNEKTIEYNGTNDPEERMNLYCQKDHVRLYGKDITKRIAKYGLKVEEFQVNNKKIEEKYGLLEKGIIYIISKEK